MDVSVLTDDAYQTAYDSMPEERKAKIDRLRFPEDKRLSLGAGLLLQKALAEHGLSPQDTVLARTESGKPYFPAHPKLHVSLSHSGTQAMCVLADCPVGCDVEKLGPWKPKIAAHFFAPEEQALFPDLPDDAARSDLFYRLWTLKESYIKAIGTGLATALDAFVISFEDTKPILLRTNAATSNVPSDTPETAENPAVLTPADPAACRFFEHTGDPDYRYSICLLAQPE